MNVTVKRGVLPQGLSSEPQIKLKNRIQCRKYVFDISGPVLREFEAELAKIVIMLRKFTELFVNGRATFHLEPGRHSSAGFMEIYDLPPQVSDKSTHEHKLALKLDEVNQHLGKFTRRFQHCGYYELGFKFDQWFSCPQADRDHNEAADQFLAQIEPSMPKWLKYFNWN